MVFGFRLSKQKGQDRQEILERHDPPRWPRLLFSATNLHKVQLLHLDFYRFIVRHNFSLLVGGWLALAAGMGRWPGHWGDAVRDRRLPVGGAQGRRRRTGLDAGVRPLRARGHHCLPRLRSRRRAFLGAVGEKRQNFETRRRRGVDEVGLRRIKMNYQTFTAV